MATSDSVVIPFIVFGNKSGPASYAAGGFELDLTAQLSFVRYLSMEIETVGSLPSDEYEVLLNRDTAGVFAPGKAVIRLLRDRYDKTTAGAVSGQPASVTVQAAKFAAANTTGSSHTHSIDHDHPSTVSSTPTAAGAGVDAALAQPAVAGHTHAIDVPNFVGSSTATTHTHDRSYEYAHGHSLGTVTDTAVSLVEVANATNLSTTTWRYLACGD